jgi:NADPH2:quinone reductase
MNFPVPANALQLHSLLHADGMQDLFLLEAPIPEPGPGEVVLRIEAAPVNPSDIGVLIGGADVGKATVIEIGGRPALRMPVPERAMRAFAARVGLSIPCGNEGAGTVVRAGSSLAAQALLGRRVAGIGGGGMYGDYRCLQLEQCLALPEGATAEEGASCFVNPLTALGMVETMKLEGHRALVHTAAASNLGQMLNRICLKDGVPLVNIVRKPEQADLLRAQGAMHVCSTSSPTFMEELTDALAATGATLAFDAIGGGKLAGQILACMEAAISRTAPGFNRYGSNVLKQVYIYGGLDLSPTEITRSFGMCWGVGGWLLFPFLNRVGPAVTAALKQRVADELHTTFASHYARRIPLAGMMDPAEAAGYGARTTGGKYLVLPQG